MCEYMLYQWIINKISLKFKIIKEWLSPGHLQLQNTIAYILKDLHWKIRK